MIFPKPIIDENTVIDLYAGNDRNYKQLLPIWEALGERQGTFFASPLVHHNGTKLQRVRNKLEGFAPIVIASYKDLNDVFTIGEERPFIMLELEHNTETRGLLQLVSLFLCKDQRTIDFRRSVSKNIVKVDSAHNVVSEIFKFCKGNEVKHTTEINGHSVGIVYMAWGEKAINGIKKSLATLRQLGYSYPVAIVGEFSSKVLQDIAPPKYTLIPCETNPFDLSKERNFKFRAGRVKPLLCSLTPFDYNLYIDADTQFIQPIHEGFKFLSDYDLAITEEKLSLNELYNKKLAGWELNMLERDTTVIELGGDDRQRFINSGVLFFRKNKKTLKLFSDWLCEWQRFQEWDEQLALMRALYKNQDLKVKRLPVEWNSPHLEEKAIIFHNYGRGDVRINPL